MNKRLISILSVGILSLSMMVGCSSKIDTESYCYKVGEAVAYKKYESKPYFEYTTTTNVGNSCIEVYFLYTAYEKFIRNYDFKHENGVEEVKIDRLKDEQSFLEYRRGYIDYLIECVNEDYTEGLASSYLEDIPEEDRDYYKENCVRAEREYGKEYKDFMFNLFDTLTEIRNKDKGQKLDENDESITKLFNSLEEYFKLDTKIQKEIGY